MRVGVLVGICAILSASTAHAESPQEAYDSALLCAATPIALQSISNANGYGEKPDPQKLAAIIGVTRTLALSFGKTLGDGTEKVNADINRKVAELSTTLTRLPTAERHDLRSKLGMFMILCAAERE